MGILGMSFSVFCIALVVGQTLEMDYGQGDMATR